MNTVLNTSFSGCRGLFMQSAIKKDLSQSERNSNINNSTNVTKYPFNYKFSNSVIAFKGFSKSSTIYDSLRNKYGEICEIRKYASYNNVDLFPHIEALNNNMKILGNYVEKGRIQNIPSDTKKLVMEMILDDNDNISATSLKLARRLLNCKELEKADFEGKHISAVLRFLSCKDSHKRASNNLLSGVMAYRDILNRHNVPKDRVDALKKSLDHENVIVRGSAVKAIGQMVGRDIIREVLPEDFNKIMSGFEPEKNEVLAEITINTLEQLSSKSRVNEGYITQEHLNKLKKMYQISDFQVRKSIDNTYSYLERDKIIEASKNGYVLVQ